MSDVRRCKKMSDARRCEKISFICRSIYTSFFLKNPSLRRSREKTKKNKKHVNGVPCKPCVAPSFATTATPLEDFRVDEEALSQLQTAPEVEEGFLGKVFGAKSS